MPLGDSPDPGTEASYRDLYRVTLILRRALVSVACLSAAVFVFSLVWAWPFTVDDTFITLRYAKNFAEKGKITWNFSDVNPAEGYTSLLWVLMTAIPAGLGWNQVLFAKLAGVLFVLLTAYTGALLTSELADASKSPDWKKAARALFAALFLGFPPAAVHAVSGMETALFTFLVSAFFLTTVRVAKVWSIPSSLKAAAIATALALSRPEGNLIALAAAGSLYLLAPRDKRRSCVSAFCSVYAIRTFLYFAWRVWYHGEILPLPFYIKVAAHRFAGLSSVLHYALKLSPVLVPALLGFSLREDWRPLWPLVSAAAATGLFFCWPAHLMGYEHRYLFPISVFVFALAALGACEILEWWCSSTLARIRNPMLRLGLAISLAGAPIAGLVAETPRALRRARDYGTSLESAHVRLGRLLGRCGSPHGEGVLAISDAGAVPYFSGWDSVDMLGLNDRAIARGVQRTAYVFSREPEVVVLISSRSDAFTPLLAYENDVYHEAVLRQFQRVLVLEFNQGYWLWVLARGDLRDPCFSSLQQTGGSGERN